MVMVMVVVGEVAVHQSPGKNLNNNNNISNFI